MAFVTLAVPERLSLATLLGLGRDIERAKDAADSRVVVLAGGKSCFCRGLDLEKVADGTDPDSSQLATALYAFADLLERLRQHPLPSVAVVGGEALGGGLGLAAVCDIAIASVGARFALPETLIGLVPATIFPYLLERCTAQRVRRLALVGASISAQEAMDIGLVDEVVPDDKLQERLQVWVRLLSRAAPQAVTRLKALPDNHAGWLRAEAARDGARHTLELLRDELTRSAIRRYLAGDAPWSDS